jgi:hypothetical protein
MGALVLNQPVVLLALLEQRVLLAGHNCDLMEDLVVVHGHAGRSVSY